MEQSLVCISGRCRFDFAEDGGRSQAGICCESNGYTDSPHLCMRQKRLKPIKGNRCGLSVCIFKPCFIQLFQTADWSNNKVLKGVFSVMKGTAIYHSPVGDIQLDWEDDAVTALKKAGQDVKPDAPNELTRLVFWQLDEYFAGTRKTFDFPYRLHGTPFQEKVWAALREIPYGETSTYKDIAEAIGHPKAFRAVGMANHANPIFIAVPCHRVIGGNGSLVGYGGGLEMKKALLELEQSNKE